MTISGHPRAKRTGMILAAAALTLGGCGKRETIGALPAAPEAAATSVATGGVQPTGAPATTERLARVVELLNQNDEKTARAELAALLAQDPTRREALTLDQSIRGNPYDIVPRNSFSYVVEPGDTFETLARDYLGDSYKFYALARISGIAANMLKPGDIVQIPGRFREAVRAGARRPRTPFVRPRSTYRPTPRTGKSVAAAPASAAATAAAPQSDPATALRFRRQGLEQMTAGRINVAVARLSRAQQLDPDNRAIAADLARARRIQGTVRTR